MADKGLVLKAIEAKLKGKSLSKNFKENLASKWAEKIESDEDIDTFIEVREDLLLEASAEADRRAVAAAKKAKEESVKNTAPVAKEEEEEVKVDDSAPEWAKALIKQNQTLSSKLEAFESKQKHQTIRERFTGEEKVSKLIKDLKDAGLPVESFESWIPKSEEDFDSSTESFIEKWSPFAEKHKLGGQGGDQPASGKGGSTGGDVKKISSEDAKAIVASMGSN